ncbi:hypothetical protein GLYMA_06G037400v4 [Glycine max]|uniref:Uncharacterized protein n=1 Tax=Glycine max TaxID=3847 RepID=I1K7X6_SOYBN|nr:hypothetical protein GYH30_013996 [Glycine max]KRH51953.1 hypothetical protein GLYMA_06G037400v4 [Glycine max]
MTLTASTCSYFLITISVSLLLPPSVKKISGNKMFVFLFSLLCASNAYLCP